MHLDYKRCKREMSYHLRFKIQAISPGCFDRRDGIHRTETEKSSGLRNYDVRKPLVEPDRSLGVLLGLGIQFEPRKRRKRRKVCLG